MRAVSSSRPLALGLLALALAAGACDHKERSNANPAAEAWTVADGAMTKRMSLLRDRQKLLAGRAAVLAIPEGTEDATLTSTIADVQGQLAAIDAACNAAEGALTQARADATAALATPDRIAAARQVSASAAAFEASAKAADGTMDQVEPRIVTGEQIMSRLQARIAAEVARLRRLATEGGSEDFSDIDFQVGSAEFDFTHPASKATLERLVKFGASCPELRFALTGYTSKEGVPAKNKALSLSRADAVKTYLVAQGVPADAIARTAGLGSATSLVDEPDPGTPAEAAMPPEQLELIRRKNRRVNVEVITPCPATPTAAAPTAPPTGAPPTPPTPPTVERPIAPTGPGAQR